MIVNHARLTGRRHRLWQHNGQDAAASGQPAAGCAFGLVADGCGSRLLASGPGGRALPSAPNEAGAALLVRFTAGWLDRRLAPALPLEALLVELGDACGRFLAQLAALFESAGEEERAGLVAGHLLATLLGFAVTPEAAAFFWAGDGFLCHDGRLKPLDAGNRPDYLAYRLLGGQGRWQVEPLPRRAGLSWLAVATDGWDPAALAGLAAPRPGLALARWLNGLARQRGRFEDDAAAAVCWLPAAGSPLPPIGEANGLR